MTKDKIKKGLECCVKLICDNCPYRNNIHCISETQQDALDLITEQEKEIEKQNSRVKCLKTRLANKMVLLANVEEQYEYKTKCFEEEKQMLADTIKNQEQEIEQLKAENERLAKVVSAKVYDFIDNVKEIADAREAWEKQAQIDVLKRLKVFSEPYPNSWGIYVIDVYHIDELIKEIEK